MRYLDSPRYTLPKIPLLFTLAGMALAGSFGCTATPAAVIDCRAESNNTVTPTVDGANCPTFAVVGTCGSVTNADIVEASGLAASRKNANVLYTHNDSGDGARILAISTSGEYLGTYYIGNAPAVDWEDMAIGPGPQSGENYLYIGDIGDNDKVRTSVNVIRVEEPLIAADAAPGVTTLGGEEVFSLVYPDKPHDAETLFVDSVSGDVFVVVKADSGKSPVFRAAAPLSSAGPITLELVTTLQFGTAPLEGDFNATGGDMTPDGAGIAIRTYDSAYFWGRKSGASVAEALAFTPCALPLQDETHGEALTFAANGQGYFTLSEGKSQPLYFYARK